MLLSQRFIVALEQGSHANMLVTPVWICEVQQKYSIIYQLLLIRLSSSMPEALFRGSQGVVDLVKYVGLDLLKASNLPSS